VGLVDTQCVPGGAGSVETCKSDNTWGAATACTSACTAESGSIGAQSCADCGGAPCSDSFLMSVTGGQGCAAIFGGGVGPCGGVPDCCTAACNPAPAPPTPAFCQ
jgi:hypothetical protein